MDQYLLSEGLIKATAGAVQRRKRPHVCFLNNKRGARSRSSKKCRKSKNPSSAQNSLQQSGCILPTLPTRLGEEDSVAAFLETSPDYHQSSEWSKRQEVEASHWEENRNKIYDAFLCGQAIFHNDISCSGCDADATVICAGCPSPYLCSVCDEQAHWLQPFHRRQHWSSGCLQGLLPTQTITSSGVVSALSAILPLQRSLHCCNSCDAGMMDIRPTSQNVIIITIQGRFDVFLPEWVCKSCGSDAQVTDEDIMKCGFFRASPLTLATVVHEDVFLFWQSLKSRSPGTSLGAFVATLQDIGAKHGLIGHLDSERLGKAYAEWSFIQFEVDQMIGSDFTACEACGPVPQCVHVDGNFKLYRYRSSGSSDTTSAYHVGTLIEDKAAVNAHVEKLTSATKINNRCGVSTWTAAKNSPACPSKRSQDETGLSIATCRHSVVLGALNMYRGESYAYAHYLRHNRFPNLQYFANDIVCKYWPWDQRVAARWPMYAVGDTKPYLSVMHASGHAYYCQILYGGFWQENSGWSIMETTEIANAHLSRAGNVTKHMTAAHRVDSLTDLALCFNRDKSKRMPYLLRRKMLEVRERIPEYEGKLTSLLSQHQVDEGDIPSLVSDLRRLAKELCDRDVESQGEGLENAIEMVSDSIRTHHASLQRVADSSKKRAKIRQRISREKKRLCGLLDLYKAETGFVISAQDAEEGCFPWHPSGEACKTLTLSDQRAICDTYMRLSRLREEIGLLKTEAGRLQSNAVDVLSLLRENEAFIAEQLALPESRRAAVLKVERRPGRYSVNTESSQLLEGLLAVTRRGVLYRQNQLQVIGACFQDDFWCVSPGQAVAAAAN